MKKFGIKSIESIKFIDKSTGEEIKDVRDIKPEHKEYDKNINSIELLMRLTIPLEWMSDEFFKQFGHDASQPLFDKWIWEREKIEKAHQEDIWKACALINGYWLNDYEYWYRKEQYEFRQYKREIGNEDKTNWKPFNLE